MSETNVSMAGFNNRTELGHRLWRWLRTMRKGAVRIVINRQDLAAKFREPTRNKFRTSTVTTIYRNLQATGFDAGVVKGARQQFDMPLDRILILNGGLDLVPSGFRKLSLVENV